MLTKIVLFSLLSCSCAFGEPQAARKLPDYLKIGAATASYQIEGAWNVSGKGENIWDRLCHQSSFVLNGDTGDVACDSYNQYKRDVEMLSELGVDFYRFSISWARLLPEGFSNVVNQDGIDYYDNLINALAEANIKAAITLYHWDLPQRLQDLGGWTNDKIVEYFADYADLVFSKYADKVEIWLTFNEPAVFCQQGYGDNKMAPTLNIGGIAEYLCMHNMLKSHARVYRLYQEKYKSKYNGRVGMTVSSGWSEPETDSEKDADAAERTMHFETGWIVNPIFSKEGNYPSVMIERIANRSKAQGYLRSRLPEFTAEEIEYIKGTADFFGINHYTSRIIREITPVERIFLPKPSIWDDVGVVGYQREDWPKSGATWLKVVPWGFTKLLRWIKTTYDNPEVMVFECGYVDHDGKDDYNRIMYYHDYMNAMMDAIDEGSHVTAFTAWSLMDNFEWLRGYSERFGLYYVDFTDPNRTRTPKLSAKYFHDIIANRAIIDTSYLIN